MQDMHHIAGSGGAGGGGGGRYFGGGDRRLRPHNHQALKCPRCDSLNTKFCYYNNYNLSQPRHFCKSCRRYWTKGGVLRNVPVGGGCRKAKRSKHKSSNAAADGDGTRDRSSNAQSSSSESSSLTASTTTPTSTAAVAAADDGSAPSNPPPPVFNFADARFITSNPSFDPTPIMNTSTDGQIFAAESFASMMTSPPEMMAFGVTDIPTTSYGHGQQGNQPSAPENNTAAPPSVVEEFEMHEMNDGGLAAALDWGSGGGGGGGGGDQGLFDLSAPVDPAYWSHTQWTDSDNQSLNFLP